MSACAAATIGRTAMELLMPALLATCQRSLVRLYIREREIQTSSDIPQSVS